MIAYDFQGLGLEALKILREAREPCSMSTCSQMMSTSSVLMTSVTHREAGLVMKAIAEPLRRVAVLATAGADRAWG